MGGRSERTKPFCLAAHRLEGRLGLSPFLAIYPGVAAGGASGVLTGYRIGNYSETYKVSADDAANGILGLGTTRSIRAKDYLRRYRRIGVAR